MGLFDRLAHRGAKGAGGTKGANKKNSADGDVGYAITSTLLGQSKKQLQTIAYNAISVAQLLKDEDTGIPPENKVSLAARIAAPAHAISAGAHTRSRAQLLNQYHHRPCRLHLQKTRFRPTYVTSPQMSSNGL